MRSILLLLARGASQSIHLLRSWRKQMKSRFLIGVLLLTANAAAQSDRKFLKSQLATEKHLPFSSGVVVGQTLYIAGTTADTDKLAAGLSAEEEARNIMEQLKRRLVGGICGSLIRSNGGESPVRSAREPVRASALCCSWPVAF